MAAVVSGIVVYTDTVVRARNERGTVPGARPSNKHDHLTYWIWHVRADHGSPEFDTVGILEVYTGFVAYAGIVVCAGTVVHTAAVVYTRAVVYTGVVVHARRVGTQAL